jgi:hypothetical protein
MLKPTAIDAEADGNPCGSRWQFILKPEASYTSAD